MQRETETEMGREIGREREMEREEEKGREAREERKIENTGYSEWKKIENVRSDDHHIQFLLILLTWSSLHTSKLIFVLPQENP